jgi:hypothetical protein
MVLFAVAAVSSCDYLNIDQYIDEEMKYDSIFSNKRYIEAYMWDAATLFPEEGCIYNNNSAHTHTPGPLATDEAIVLWNTSDYPGMAFVMGEINADNVGNFNKWATYYKIIRQCNTIFARMDEASDWTTSDRLRVTAYTRFIRAYAYYNLLVNYGPVILLYDEVLNNNDEMEYYDRPRDLYDDCVEYICSEFEQAAKYMSERMPSILEYGRPTKGAALALVARLRLIHASPQFNGGPTARTYFGNWTRKTDGKHYIAQTPDTRRWAVAAAAAKRVIDLTVGGQPAYELHYVEDNDDTPALPEGVEDPDFYNEFPNGAAGIDPLHSYADMFNGETVMNVNKEFIWARASGSMNAATQYSFPSANGGWNGLSIPQKIIDAYETADGHEISEAGDSYSETGFTSEPKTLATEYRLNAGVFNMYANREMRFYASIGFSECHWTCSSTMDNTQKNLTITYYYNSPNGKSNSEKPLDYPITGYVLKKLVHPMDAYNGTNARRFSKPFPIIRYAEILLSYAEALNNLGGESFEIEVNGEPQTFRRDVNEIRKYINQVRYRAGLPGLTVEQAGDPDYVDKKIKKERMVEFLCENRRYFDVRRWGEYELSESEPITGMNTSANKDSYYQRIVPNHIRITNRVVNRRLMFLPVPKGELKRVSSFDQNPGW